MIEDEEFLSSCKIETIPKDIQKVWNAFYSDMDLMEEIQKDIRRTRSDLNFFISPIDSRDKPKNEAEKKRLEM